MLRARLGRRSACPIVLALSALAFTVPLASASTPGIAITRVDTKQFPLVQVTLRMPAGSTSRPIRASENGRPIQWHLAQGAARQAIALSVDTSNSMQGARMAAVLNAAISFVEQQPGDVLLGVYSFSAQAHPAAAFPATHEAAIATLRQLGTAGPDGTALYAGVIQASSGLNQVNALQRALILVTDGQSFRDQNTLPQAIKAAQAAGVSVYPVAIITAVSDFTALRRLARATGGALSFARSGGDLKRLYHMLARRIAAGRTYAYLSRAHSYQALHLLVTVKGIGTARFLVPPVSPKSRPTAPPNVALPLPTLAALAVAAVCVLFGVGFALARLRRF